jgi:hypothetical protein
MQKASFVDYTMSRKIVELASSTKLYLDSHLFSIGECVHVFKAHSLDNTGQKRRRLIRYYLLQKAVEIASADPTLHGQTSEEKLKSEVEAENDLLYKLATPRVISLVEFTVKRKSPNGPQTV